MVLESGVDHDDGSLPEHTEVDAGRGFMIPSVGFGWKVWPKPSTYQI